MNEQNLRTVFATVTAQPADSPIVGELVAAYLKDGSQASDQDVNESPENIWLKLEFEKADHKERVDSNNLDPGAGRQLLRSGGLRRSVAAASWGRSVLPSSRTSAFSRTWSTIDKRLVDGLISSGTCRNLGSYYVRTLHDYEEAFHDIQDRFIRRQEDIAACTA